MCNQIPLQRKTCCPSYQLHQGKPQLQSLGPRAHSSWGCPYSLTEVCCKVSTISAQWGSTLIDNICHGVRQSFASNTSQFNFSICPTLHLLPPFHRYWFLTNILHTKTLSWFLLLRTQPVTLPYRANASPMPLNDRKHGLFHFFSYQTISITKIPWE